MSLIQDHDAHYPILSLPMGAHPFRRKPVCGIGVWVFVESIPPNKWPMHHHDHWQITFVFGPAVCNVAWRTPSGHTFRRRIISGQFWIVPARWMHSVQWSEKADMISLYIGSLQIEQFGTLNHEVVVRTLADCVSIQPMIVEQCAYLLRFGAVPNGRSDWQVACIGSSLAAGFLDAYRLLGRATVKPTLGLTAAIVEEVKQFVAKHPRGRLPVAEIARSVGTSPRNFRRSFRMVMGESPQKWALVQKARRAKQLLQSGLSIKETVTKGAFADARHLNRVLRAVYNVTARALHPHSIRRSEY